MTVYELIQELARFDADTEVEVSILANSFRTEVVAKEDAEYGDSIDAEEYTDDFSVEDYQKYTGKHVVRINVTL